MHYAKRFIHRMQEDFLVVGAFDYEELSDIAVLHNRYLELSLDALHCIRFFPNVEFLILTPGDISYDGFCELDGIRIKALKLDYYSYEMDAHTIDLACFPQLELVVARTEFCFKNAVACSALQTLVVQEWLTSSLESLAGSAIKALKLCLGKLTCVCGVERMPQLISLSISHQRHLIDCGFLAATHLESIEIIGCNNLDISQIPQLSNVRMIHFSGKMNIASVYTILRIAPRLEWLLLDHRVIEGNLEPLKDLLHAVIFTDCRHYSLKDCDLPKASGKFHSRFLPFELEILPEAY